MDPVRITGVACHTRTVPLATAFVTALREVRALEVVAISLQLSDGGAGEGEVVATPPITGETTGSIIAAVEGHLGPAITGCALDEPAEISRRLSGAIVGNTTAKCGVDLALFDAAVNRAGVPLSRLLGAVEGRVRTDVTVSLGAPAEMAASAAARCAEGYDVVKLKVGTDVAVDRERILAVRDAVAGRAALRLDANQGWQWHEAVSLCGTLADMGVEIALVEQPVPAGDLDGLARVRAAIPWPVLADESVHGPADVVRLAERGAADLVNVKLAKCGGLKAAIAMVAVAREHGLGVIVGSMMEPPRTVAAAVALAAAVAPEVTHDLDAALWSKPSDDLVYAAPFVRVEDPPGR